MESLLIGLLGKMSIDLALVVLKNIQGVTTIDQAIAALEKIKTAQEYLEEDAARRGVPVKPLPGA